MIRFAAAALALLTCNAFADTPTNDIDSLRDEITEAVATPQHIWITHWDGALRSYDLNGRLETETPDSGCYNLENIAGEVWCLRWRSPWQAHAAEPITLKRLDGGPAFESPPLTLPAGETPTALIITSDAQRIISSRNIYRLEDDEWRSTPLQQPIARGFSRSHVLLADGRTLYLAFDNGEWGGGMHRIDLQTGRVDSIERRDTPTLCDGPLNSECNPVTSVIADEANPNCVIASVGLAHLGMLVGRVLRVCGAEVQQIFERAAPRDHLIPGTVPIDGLVPSPDGFWALTDDTLIQFVHGRAGAGRAIELRQTGALRMDLSLPGFLVLSGPPARTVQTHIPGTTEPMETRVGGHAPVLVPIVSRP